MTDKAVAIIPARGGSKRIPRKNIKLFCGKPIIAYAIETALNSDCFEKVIVSTDDEEIAEIALKFGAEIPYLRAKSLADDYATTIDVMADAVNRLPKEIDYACCVYATSPLLIAEDIKKGLSLIKQKKSNYAFSITSYPYPIQRALKLDDSEKISMFNPEHFLTRSQDLIEAWHDAGQFYWGTTEAWKNKTKIFSHESIGVKVPRKRVQDIDTLEDWDMAEFLYRVMNKNE